MIQQLAKQIQQHFTNILTRWWTACNVSVWLWQAVMSPLLSRQQLMSLASATKFWHKSKTTTTAKKRKSLKQCTCVAERLAGHVRKCCEISSRFLDNWMDYCLQRIQLCCSFSLLKVACMYNKGRPLGKTFKFYAQTFTVTQNYNIFFFVCSTQEVVTTLLNYGHFENACWK